MMVNDELKEVIYNAEIILIGMGEEWDDKLSDMAGDPIYQKALNELGEEPEMEWNRDLLFYDYLQTHAVDRRVEAYNTLQHLIADKDYFIVSTCKNGEIRKSRLKPDRIVEPCGGYEFLQCSENCSMDLYHVPEELQEELRRMIYEIPGKIKKMKPYTCPECGKELVFHNISTPNYSQKGYLEQWKNYTAWLQGTLNRKLCILELGVGMAYPSVIRWPFEKIVFYNHRAEFIRVHKKLSQIPEEIKEKGISVPENAIEFIKKLS